MGIVQPWRLPIPSTCVRCKAPLLPRAKFCGRCGCPAASTTRTATRSSPLPPPAPPGGGGGVTGLPHRYEVVRFLGNGAMGRVYRCLDTELGVEVAVKILMPEVAADRRSVERIRKEARAAALLRGCPGILSHYGFERSGESWYLVMEYAPGGSLRDRIRKLGRLAEAECWRIGGAVAVALAFAHERSILHRDIKPANILFGADGRPMIGDFGVAKVLADHAPGSRPTTIAGTPVYMAPEIMLRQKADGRADLFSLGCTMFEAATGEMPYAGDFLELAVAKGDPGCPAPDPREAFPGISAAFSSVVRRLLAPDPDRRFPTATACATAFRRRAAATGRTTGSVG